MCTRMSFFDVRDRLYTYGRELALSHEKLSPNQIEMLAIEKLEQDAYDLMHSLLQHETKAIGVQACRDGYRGF